MNFRLIFTVELSSLHIFAVAVRCRWSPNLTSLCMGVERVVLDLHPIGLAHPLPERFIQGPAFGAVEGLLQAGEHLRRKRDEFA